MMDLEEFAARVKTFQRHRLFHRRRHQHRIRRARLPQSGRRLDEISAGAVSGFSRQRIGAHATLAAQKGDLRAFQNRQAEYRSSCDLRFREARPTARPDHAEYRRPAQARRHLRGKTRRTARHRSPRHLPQMRQALRARRRLRKLGAKNLPRRPATTAAAFSNRPTFPSASRCRSTRCSARKPGASKPISSSSSARRCKFSRRLPFPSSPNAAARSWPSSTATRHRSMISPTSFIMAPSAISFAGCRAIARRQLAILRLCE